MQKISLIASDIDGTLLRHGAVRIEQEVFDEIRRLRSQGILFCPASGRQYKSIRTLFEPVADDLAFVCENGALGMQNEKVLFKTVMDRELCRRLVQDILGVDGCEVLISGENISYLMPRGNEIVDIIARFTGNNVCIVQSFEDIREEIIKVSAFHPDGAQIAVDALSGRWSSVFHAAVAGASWYDFTLATKGSGLRQLCERLGIDLSEVAAFGDNFNDVAMLDVVGCPYIMNGADEALLRRYPNKTESVLEVLRTL